MTQRMTVAAAARALRVSESTVRRRIARGELRAVRSMGDGRTRWWVLLDGTPGREDPATPPPVPPAGRPAPIWSLDTARPALPRGTGWCLRDRRSYAWLKAWGIEVEFTPRFTDAFWFDSRLSAERAARELALPVDVVEVARVAA